MKNDSWFMYWISTVITSNLLLLSGGVANIKNVK